MPGLTRPSDAAVVGSGDIAGIPRGDLADAIQELASAVQTWAAQAPRDSDALLTAEQLGELFALSPRTVKDQAAAGVFPHRRFGKHYRFSRDDVVAIVQLMECAARPQRGALRAA